MMKKTMILVMILCIMSALAACGKETSGNDTLTLDGIRNDVANAGYTIIENYAETYAPYEEFLNSTGGFTFVFQGEHGHGNTYIPVLEFQDHDSAKAHARNVNSQSDLFAVVNDTFLAIGAAHDDVPHENEKIFLENLINGSVVKKVNFWR